MKLERMGKVAVVRYEGGVQGEVAFDGSLEGTPKRIELGAGLVARGMEDALLEMQVGETRTVVIPPEKGFGEYDPTGVRIVQRELLAGGCELEAGSVVYWTNPVSNMSMPVRVTEATKDYVKIDHNHPFAGKTLEYRIVLDGLE